jgi:hypothetical protein
MHLGVAFAELAISVLEIEFGRVASEIRFGFRANADLEMRIACERPAANSKLLPE